MKVVKGLVLMGAYSDKDLPPSVLQGCFVYFMSDNVIHRGYVTGMDDHQIFVANSHCIQHGKDFFYSMEDLLRSLSSTVVTLEEKK